MLAAATGALFEAGSLTITLIISPPFPFLALTLNQLLVPPELALDTVALSIDVLTSASSSKYSLQNCSRWELDSLASSSALVALIECQVTTSASKVQADILYLVRAYSRLVSMSCQKVLDQSKYPG